MHWHWQGHPSHETRGSVAQVSHDAVAVIRLITSTTASMSQIWIKLEFRLNGGSSFYTSRHCFCVEIIKRSTEGHRPRNDSASWCVVSRAKFGLSVLCSQAGTHSCPTLFKLILTDSAKVQKWDFTEAQSLRRSPQRLCLSVGLC